MTKLPSLDQLYKRRVHETCSKMSTQTGSSANKYIWSVNPLLSLTDDKHSPNVDYTNCDLYDNLSSVNGSNISNGDDSNIINGDDSSLTDHDINCDTDSFSIVEDHRNNTNFWRPITYITNLSYGKGTTDKTETWHKMQDEHTCLLCAFQPLQKNSEEGGFDLVVLGEQVSVRVWIHFFIGDTEGNNKWLGQYPGNREGVQWPYCDCKCSYDKLSTPNPTCDYITLMDVNEAKRRKRVDIDKQKNYFSSQCCGTTSELHFWRNTYLC